MLPSTTKKKTKQNKTKENPQTQKRKPPNKLGSKIKERLSCPEMKHTSQS